MYKWSVLFLIGAVVTGLLGLWALAGLAAIIAKAFFGAFLLLCIVAGIEGFRIGLRIGHKPKETSERDRRRSEIDRLIHR